MDLVKVRQLVNSRARTGTRVSNSRSPFPATTYLVTGEGPHQFIEKDVGLGVSPAGFKFQLQHFLAG